MALLQYMRRVGSHNKPSCNFHAECSFRGLPTGIVCGLTPRRCVTETHHPRPAPELGYVLAGKCVPLPVELQPCSPQSRFPTTWFCCFPNSISSPSHLFTFTLPNSSSWDLIFTGLLPYPQNKLLITNRRGFWKFFFKVQNHFFVWNITEKPIKTIEREREGGLPPQPPPSPQCTRPKSLCGTTGLFLA